MSEQVCLFQERIIKVQKRSFIHNSPLLKMFILFVVVAISGLSIYTVAETVKETNLKEQLVVEQEDLTNQVIQFLNEDILEQQTIEDVQKVLTDFTDSMDRLQVKTEKLSKENQLIFRPQTQKITDNIQMLKDLIAIRQSQDSLFDEAVLNQEGLNQEAKIKEGLTLMQIADVEKAISLNPQAPKMAQETIMVVDFAKRQVETKSAVDTWYTKNQTSYSMKNYQTFEKLVKAVTPTSVRKTYEKSLVEFKKAVDNKIKKEKAEAEEKAKQEALKQKQIATFSGNQEVIDSVEESNEINELSDTPQSNAASPEKHEPSKRPAPPVALDPTPRTDGFNFKGQHFDLSSFSGLGMVPQWTPYIYQWADDPSHYLIEKASDAGNAIWSVGIGDQVVINGQTYTVFHQMSNVVNDDTAYGILKSQGATVTWQTCDYANPDSTLTIWFAS